MGIFFAGDMLNLERISIQGLGVLVVFAWGFGVALICYFLIDKIIGMRTSSLHEQRGLDFTEHAEIGYPEFQDKTTGISHTSTKPHKPSLPSQEPSVNPSQKRKAVEQALMPFLQGNGLASALILRDEKYAHKPTFALQHYLRELCSDLEIAHMRSRMLQALVTAMSSAQDDHQNQVAENRRPTAPKPQSSPILLMFMALVDGLIDAPGGEASTRMRLYVLENLAKVSLSPTERWAFHAWLNQVEPLTGTTPSIHTLQQVINLAYVALCEYLEPIKADQILQNTVSRVQKAHPHSNVRSLL